MAARVSLSGITSEKRSVWDPETDGRSIRDDFPEDEEYAAEVPEEFGGKLANVSFEGTGCLFYRVPIREHNPSKFPRDVQI